MSALTVPTRSHFDGKQARLISIESAGPVRARQRGYGKAGLDWTVQPEDFESLIVRINETGGPEFWTITEA